MATNKTNDQNFKIDVFSNPTSSKVPTIALTMFLKKRSALIVKINCEFSSDAHSDGDVLTHAITDALLGALNLGDIGEHFPNTPEYLNISSIKLLQKIIKKIQRKYCKIRCKVSTDS